MENIQNSNFQALYQFTKSVSNDLAKNNKKVVMTNVQVIYKWKSETEIVETQCYIALDTHPFAKMSLIGTDWLNAEEFYVEFQTGYNEFRFDIETATLYIENNSSSKMGSYYQVEIKEL
ncbi:hypothetical protein [Chryseobacterium indoltheticum]|uniref:hypothetical protein n=1 Tax=Chryseobacterium indoltheticum TaxID=254 RepID=UPI0040429D18